ncbi:MAG: hypothetical protein ACFFDF_22460 [Candidatus Odinarchaeota archaeon]
MKTLNIPLEDKKYKALKKVKGARTWHEFLDDIIESEEIINQKYLKEEKESE